MRKTMQWLWLIVFFACLTHTTYALSNKQMDQMPLEQVAREITTPNELENYLSTLYLYKTDLENFGKDDYWASPEELIKRRAGDCEDFAVFSKYILERHGYSCWVIAYGTKSKISHAILIYQLKPELPFGVMSNQFNYGYFGHDFNNIVKKFSRDAKNWSVLLTDESGHYYGSEDHTY